MQNEISCIDMAPIYRSLITEHHIQEFPEILIFKKIENGGKVLRCTFDDERSIIFLKQGKRMVDFLAQELKEERAPVYPAQENLFHPLTNDNFGLLATVCVLISEMLDVPCPQLIYRQNQDKYGVSIAEINVVCIQVTDNSDDRIIDSIRFMAHEIRHLWQYINRPEYFADSNRSDRTMDEYFMSEEENDAEAFANKFFYELTGVDTIAASPGYASGNKEIIKKIRKLEKDIELDMGRIHVLKKLLGFE